MINFWETIIRNRQKVYFFWLIGAVAIAFYSLMMGCGFINGTVTVKLGSKMFLHDFTSGYIDSLNYFPFYLLFSFGINSYIKYISLLKNLDFIYRKSKIITLSTKAELTQIGSHTYSFITSNKFLLIIIIGFIYFSYQANLVELDRKKNLMIGFFQSRDLHIDLKENFKFKESNYIINNKVCKGFLFNNKQMSFKFNKLTSDKLGIQLNEDIINADTVIINKIKFISNNIPSEISFNIFLLIVKLQYIIFQLIIFSFNIICLFSVYKYSSRNLNLEELVNEDFKKTINEFTNLAFSFSFWSTCYLLLRFVTNYNKGSFSPWNESNILLNDRYLFLLNYIFVFISFGAYLYYNVFNNPKFSISIDSITSLSIKMLVIIFFIFTINVYVLSAYPKIYSNIYFMQFFYDLIHYFIPEWTPII